MIRAVGYERWHVAQRAGLLLAAMTWEGKACTGLHESFVAQPAPPHSGLERKPKTPSHLVQLFSNNLCIC